MFGHDPMLSLRAVAGLTAMLAASTSAHAQAIEKPAVIPPPAFHDVKTVEAPFIKPASRHLQDGQQSATAMRSELPSSKVEADPIGKSAGLTFLPEDRYASPVFDVAADGSIWVRGKSYKARFATDGFTYIPWFGGDAPRNFPIDFFLDAIDINGESVELAQPTVTREGHRITINRGAVLKVYDVSGDAIEQLFIFPTEMANGDTTIRMHVKSELVSSQVNGQIAFASDAFGHVTYSNAIAIDAFNVQTDVGTTLADTDLLEIALPASLMADAKYPLTIDPVLMTFALNAPAGTTTVDGRSDIAYDSTSNTWLLVWEEHFSASDGDIYTIRCDANGQVVGGTLATINGDSANARKPRIANNNFSNEFLIVYELGHAPNRHIWGRSRSNSGFTVGSEFQISSPITSGDHHSPDVGGDPLLAPPTYFCVVWQRDLSATDTDILGRLTHGAGNATFGDTIPLSNSANTLDRRPAISNSNSRSLPDDQHWTIVFERQFSSTDRDIWGVQVKWDGTITHPLFAIDTSINDERNPTVSTLHEGSNRYLIAYDRGGQAVWASLMHGNTKIDSRNLTAMESPWPGATTWAPVVDATFDKFIVAYQQIVPGFAHTDAFAATLCGSTGVIRVAEAHRPLAILGHDEVQLALASAYVYGASSTSRNALATWTQLLGPQYGQVKGALYQAHSSCCMTDIAPPGGDGQTDVSDLLAVIGQWGSDVNASANINGDSTVNVTDLLMVIAGWGQCQ